MNLRTLTPQDVAGKTAVVRVTFNVPLTQQNGRWMVSDDQRIQSSLQTLQFLLEHQAKVIILSHVGRPKGVDPALSLQPIAQYLVEKLNLPVTFMNQTVGHEVRDAVSRLQPGRMLLLENTRFLNGEETNDPQLAQELASFGDIYVNDAFPDDHRAHASTEGIAHYLPSYAGFSLAKEVEMLNTLLTNPPRPFMCVVGGAKISDKVGALTNLAKVADTILVGGGVANVFLKAQGLEIHHSYLEDAPVDVTKRTVNYVEVAKNLLEQTKTERYLDNGYIPLPKIVYPVDVIAAPVMESQDVQTIDLTHDARDTANDKNLMYLDIGPKTQQLYAELLSQAKGVFWNGPMGVFEKPPFAEGTKQVATAITQNKGFTVMGGGDTVAAAQTLGLTSLFTYVSMAGGASLEFLSGTQLPGLQALIQK